jgi:hypothetical protein
VVNRDCQDVPEAGTAVVVRRFYSCLSRTFISRVINSPESCESSEWHKGEEHAGMDLMRRLNPILKDDFKELV